MSSSNEPSSTPASPKTSLISKLSSVVLTVQFLWFFGHVATLVNCALYIVYLLKNPTSSPYFYQKALLANLISYAIVMYKSYANVKVQLNMAFLSRLLLDENMQYLLLATFLYTSPNTLVALVPYATFSFFHCISYLRTHLLPALSNQLTAKYDKPLLELIQTYQLPAIVRVSYIEVVGVMGTFILNAITFQGSFMAPIFYAQFLRLRYAVSKNTRDTFSDLRIQLDAKLLSSEEGQRVSQSSPPPPHLALKERLWIRIRNFICSLAQQTS